MQEKNKALEAENAELKTANSSLQAEVTCAKGIIATQRENSEPSRFWSKTAGPIRKQGGRSSQWSESLKVSVLKCLARGIEVSSIRRVMLNIVAGMKLAVDVVPSASSMCEWRQNDLSVINDRQLRSFLEKTQTLTICLDCASYSDHKVHL